MKQDILNQFTTDSLQLCIQNGVKINGVRQQYFEAKPVVSFWVGSKAITSVTFREFKKGVKYSVVVNEKYTAAFAQQFGEASAPAGKKTYSNTWNTYDLAEFIQMVDAFS